METSTVNEYEARARLSKAMALASKAREGGYTSTQVGEFTDGQWDLLAQAAGKNEASTLTRVMTVQMMAGAEIEAARTDDPFRGL